MKFTTLTLSTLLLVACSDTVAPPAGPTATQACEAYARANCARQQACSNGFLITRVYADLATCEQRTRDGCVASLAANGTGQTPANVQACAAAFPTVACADLLNGDNLPAACATPVGRLAMGAACRYAAQCQSSFCAVPTGTNCGTCGPRPSAGAPCNGPGAPVGCGGGGLSCVGETATAPGTCLALGARGSLCDATRPCGAGLSCTPVAVTAPRRTCEPAGTTVGAACGGASAPGCDGALGLACNPMTRTCATISVVAAGVACGLRDDGTFAACANSGDCQGYTLMTPRGTCRASAAEGAACDRAQGPFCRTPASCVTAGGGTAGTCVLPVTCG
jgi:hypothetical protein